MRSDPTAWKVQHARWLELRDEMIPRERVRSDGTIPHADARRVALALAEEFGGVENLDPGP